MRKLSEIDKEVESLYQILSKEKVEVEQLDINQVGRLANNEEVVVNQQVLLDELIKIRKFEKFQLKSFENFSIFKIFDFSIFRKFFNFGDFFRPKFMRVFH